MTYLVFGVMFSSVDGLWRQFEAVLEEFLFYMFTLHLPWPFLLVESEPEKSKLLLNTSKWLQKHINGLNTTSDTMYVSLTFRTYFVNSHALSLNFN